MTENQINNNCENVVDIQNRDLTWFDNLEKFLNRPNNLTLIAKRNLC